MLNTIEKKDFTIAVDLNDNIVKTNRHFMNFIEKIYKLQIKERKIAFSEELAGIYKIDNKGLQPNWKKMRGHFMKTKKIQFYEPIDHAIHVLKYLKNIMKIKFILITGTNEKYSFRVNNTIKKYFDGIFDKIIFINTPKHRQSKSMMCKKYGIDLLIDDSPRYIKDAIDNNIDVIHFGDYPWSHLLDIKYRKSSRYLGNAINWYDIMKIILNYGFSHNLFNECITSKK